MINQLDALERKIAQIVGVCEMLRADNIQLRQQLLVAENERDEMAERMTAARERIERLALQLPETKATDA